MTHDISVMMQDRGLVNHGYNGPPVGNHRPILWKCESNGHV